MNKKKIKNRLLVLVDGFNGILALMIYNFLLFTFVIIERVVGVVKYETGFFYVNISRMMGFSRTGIAIWIISTFAFAFLLGNLVGKLVRRYKKQDV